MCTGAQQIVHLLQRSLLFILVITESTNFNILLISFYLTTNLTEHSNINISIFIYVFITYFYNMKCTLCTSYMSSATMTLSINKQTVDFTPCQINEGFIITLIRITVNDNPTPFNASFFKLNFWHGIFNINEKKSPMYVGTTKDISMWISIRILKERYFLCIIYVADKTRRKI